jgi:nuclear inhibitor of protein phosphatase 1
MTENHYDVPKWAGTPAPGLHLDVVKDGKLIQKLMIDEKKCYLFGRNPNLCDVCIDHASCSRVHSALVYHKHLERAFLVDLGRAHGTYIGNIRIEAETPTQLPVDTTFHFGASTRYYTLREKSKKGSDGPGEDGELNLPDNEVELDSLTEYNTASNKKISMIGIGDELRKKRKRNAVCFKEEDDIINPEDIDPTVGKFRNLVQTAIVPRKKLKVEDGGSDNSYGGSRMSGILRPGTSSEDHDNTSSGKASTFNPLLSNSLSIKLGIQLPNPAPALEDEQAEFSEEDEHALEGPHPPSDHESEDPLTGKKKKYAKEAWPGKMSGLF